MLLACRWIYLPDASQYESLPDNSVSRLVDSEFQGNHFPALSA